MLLYGGLPWTTCGTPGEMTCGTENRRAGAIIEEWVRPAAHMTTAALKEYITS